MSGSLLFVLPEQIMAAGAVVLLLGGVFGLRRGILGLTALLTLLAGVACLPGTLDGARVIFSGMLLNDMFGFVMRSFILLVAGLAVLMSIGYTWPDNDDAGEYYFFLLTATIAMTLAVTSGHLLMIYLSVETLSITSYVLACYFKKDFFSTEAGLKYFLFGALSTGLMLYGISLVYGIFGTLDLADIGRRMPEAGAHHPLLVLAAVLVFAGLAFKAGIAPFHMWVADVYEGAPWPVAAFFSIGPKALGFALLVRVFFGYSLFVTSSWAGVAVVLSIATMTIGNFSAFHQQSVKRLLAFSSVAQAGYILAGLASGALGLQAAFFYIFVYAFMNIGAFACAAFLSSERAEIQSFQGLARRSPFGAAFFSLFLLSLAGLPPLAGFLAKFFVVRAAVLTTHYGLAAAVMLNSLVAFFFYLKVIKAMYIDEPVTDARIGRIPVAGKVLIVLCALAVVVFGLCPSLLTGILARVFI